MHLDYEQQVACVRNAIANELGLREGNPTFPIVSEGGTVVEAVSATNDEIALADKIARRVVRDLELVGIIKPPSSFGSQRPFADCRCVLCRSVARD